MVQTEQHSITTRLQSRIDVQDEKIQALTNEMKSLTNSVHSLSSTVQSMQEILKSFPTSMEKFVTDLIKHQGKQPVTSDTVGSIHVLGSTSGGKPPGGPGSVNTTGFGSGINTPGGNSGFTSPNHRLDTSLFSLPKVKLPLFDGLDPRGWITKATLYFQVHHTPADQKLTLVQMCMDGVALNWFSNLLIRHPHTNWDQFRMKLMHRFSGTRFLNAYEALASLNQEGDVDGYIEDFEAISALISDQSEDQSIGLFLRGLQPEIRNWVRTLNPLTCEQAMEFARHIEVATHHDDDGSGRSPTGDAQALLWKTKVRSTGPTHFRPTPFVDTPARPNPQLIHQPNLPGPIPARPLEVTNATRNSGTRHLTKLEWEDRRKRGLCFGCGQKYSPQHKCPEGGLRIMLLGDGELVDDTGEVYSDEAAV